MNDLRQAYDGSMSLRVCYIAAAAAEFAIGPIRNLQGMLPKDPICLLRSIKTRHSNYALRAFAAPLERRR
jgi:hypothetical protein